MDWNFSDLDLERDLRLRREPADSSVRARVSGWRRGTARWSWPAPCRSSRLSRPPTTGAGGARSASGPGRRPPWRTSGRLALPKGKRAHELNPALPAVTFRRIPKPYRSIRSTRKLWWTPCGAYDEPQLVAVAMTGAGKNATLFDPTCWNVLQAQEGERRGDGREGRSAAQVRPARRAPTSGSSRSWRSTPPRAP